MEEKQYQDEEPQGTEILPKNKGGRPPKKIKRDTMVVVRMTAVERIIIESKARTAGMKVAEWFRRAAKAAKVMARLTARELELMRMLTGMANNLNQLVKLAHQEGLLSVQRKCRELLSQIDDTLKYLNNDDRKSHDR